jgi:hypothetical protein
MMHKNYVWPTKVEREREKAARKLGCVLSRLRAAKGLPVPKKGPIHIHHLVKPGKRYGHTYSVPLHSWYHEAVVPYPCPSKAEARQCFGASIKHGSKAFVADHELTEWDLYDETQRLLGLPAERPPTKIVPRRVA